MEDNKKNALEYLAISKTHQLRLSRFQFYENLRANAAKQSSKSLIVFGRKIYSQNEEDGIISEIFKRIGTTNKIFVEFGVENGLECNTRALLFYGWRGLWIESNIPMVQCMKEELPITINTGQLSVLQAFINKNNINELISSKIHEKEIDLLSVDIDGNDYHILCAITCVKPRVIVIEYNSKFPPPIQYCKQYNENHIWNGSDDYGASIAFYDKALNEMGYKLVVCDLTGSNAFFVREELIEDKFHEPCNAEHHYQPARYFLNGITSGHPASNGTIENRLRV